MSTIQKDLGVIELNEKSDAISIEEKPKNPKSNYCVTGLYFYPSCVSKKQRRLSRLQEANQRLQLLTMYLEDHNIHVTTLGMGYSWLDAGTHESLVEASNYIKSIEDHQRLKVCCPEEIAYKKVGFLEICF